MPNLVQLVMDQLQHNQFAAGGAVVMGLGALLASLRTIPGTLWGLVKNRLQAQLEVTSDSPPYFWMTLWLAEQGYAKRMRNVALVTDRDMSTRRRRNPLIVTNGEDPEGANYVLSLGRGEHLFWWRGRPVWVDHDRDKSANDATSKAYIHTLKLTSYGMSRADLEMIIEEAKAAYDHINTRNPSVYVSRWEDDWREEPRAAIRSQASLVLDESTRLAVIEDARRFLAQRERYRALGVPMRRGYLLYGPPGTGKTSLAMALADALHRDLCIMPIGRLGLADDMLQSLMANLPPHPVVLFEDIDTVFEGRENLSKNSLTFSGFLNAIDGVLAQEDVIVVMTTNRREVLDEALLRPGRLDVHVHIGPASFYQAEQLYLRFFPDNPVNAKVFAACAGGATMAYLQEHLVRHMDDPDYALAAWPVSEEVAV